MRLIDADELLKRVDEERQYLLARGQTGAEHILVHNFRELIVNAPTVEYPFYQEAYQTGYEEGKNERPQGEWLPNYTSLFSNPGRSCSICGKIVEFSENYCPQCGADMRGDKNG